MKFCPIDKGIKGGVTFCDFPIRTSQRRKPLEFIDDIPHCTREELLQMKDRINRTEATNIICSRQLTPFNVLGKNLYFVTNPRLTFMRLVKKFYMPPLYLGEHVHIGMNVEIGPCSIIGGPGFGMWRKKDGSIVSFKQIGTVVIEDNVEIHSNVCIDRGSLGETRIGSGTKIDNLVHIAHNAKIGKDCIIVAHAMIGGSVTIGDRTWIGPGALILNGLTIGSDCVIGIGSVVLRNVKNGEVVKGLVK